MSLNRPTISVSELTSKLKDLIESNFSNIWIQGEISDQFINYFQTKGRKQFEIWLDRLDVYGPMIP